MITKYSAYVCSSERPDTWEVWERWGDGVNINKTEISEFDSREDAFAYAEYCERRHASLEKIYSQMAKQLDVYRKTSIKNSTHYATVNGQMMEIRYWMTVIDEAMS